MPDSFFYEFESLSIVDVIGKDAEKIVHNLTTNDVRGLSEAPVESFVTNIKGKTLGHVSVVKIPDGLRLIGAPGQSETLAAHIDRYTIVEDAVATIRDSELRALIIMGDIVGMHDELQLIPVAWVGPSASVALMPGEEKNRLIEILQASGFQSCDERGFHCRRIQSGFPWFGTDFGDNHLPQELDRDSFAISFTKGCYLGQETVARLDALGQVQKKLVKWRVSGAIPTAGDELKDQEKTVGKITSVCSAADGNFVALGMARRSHFDEGSVAIGQSNEGESYRAEVLAFS